jgi:RND superfamily putative drug exporter
LVLAGWLLVLVAAAGAAGVLKGSTNDAFNVPGTESQQAIDLLAHKSRGRAARPPGS